MFVYWCEACGHEAADEEYLACPRCSGRVQRHQRILELPDSSEGDSAFSFHSLKAALAEVCGGDDPIGAALVFSQQGPHPEVVNLYPEFASQLAELGVPPRVQEALVRHRYLTLDDICAAVASVSETDTWTQQLGLPPAAEVLLRRLWQAALDKRDVQEQKRKKSSEVVGSPFPHDGLRDATSYNVSSRKRFCATESICMETTEDESNDAETYEDQGSDSEDIEVAA